MKVISIEVPGRVDPGDRAAPGVAIVTVDIPSPPRSMRFKAQAYGLRGFSATGAGTAIQIEGTRYDRVFISGLNENADTVQLHDDLGVATQIHTLLGTSVSMNAIRGSGVSGVDWVAGGAGAWAAMLAESNIPSIYMDLAYAIQTPGYMNMRDLIGSLGNTLIHGELSPDHLASVRTNELLIPALDWLVMDLPDPTSVIGTGKMARYEMAFLNYSVCPKSVLGYVVW